MFASGTGAATAYYADSPEGPGRWLGAGAAFHRLDGAVERDSFQRVLDGRHPISGARLVTARGSSQRGHLAVGTAAAFDGNGEALYTVADTASLLGLRRTDVEELIAAGTTGGRRPSGRIRGWRPSRTPWGSSCRTGRSADISTSPPHRRPAPTVLGGGHANDQLTTAEAATLSA